MARHPETDAIIGLLAKLQLADITLRIRPEPVPLPETSVKALLSLLQGDWIQHVHGYFQNHRPQSPYAKLDDEYKVQDLVFCLASSLVPDLHYENPQAKSTGAITSTRVDFTSKSLSTFLEVKLATSTHKAKQVEKEISEDIVKYGKQTGFSLLIFYVYCHNYSLPNAKQFEKGLSGKHNIAGHAFETVCIVKP